MRFFRRYGSSSPWLPLLFLSALLTSCFDSSSTGPRGTPADAEITTSSDANHQTPAASPSPAVGQRQQAQAIVDPIGAACDPTNNNCETGECVDVDGSGMGVCCAQTCDGLCMSCRTTLTGVAPPLGSPADAVGGICAPITAGVDPAGECGFYLCGGQKVVASTDPTLAPGGGQNPGQGGESACYAACTVDSQCDEDGGDNIAGNDDDAWCYTLTGICTDRSADGTDCADSSTCASTFCVDGSCCVESCDATCVSCNSTYTGGQSGVCSDVVIHLDPGNDCSDENAASCGTSGACDGSGACSTYPNDTVCSGAICNNGDVQNDSTCQTGLCTVPALVECGVWACRDAICNTTCASNSDCATSVPPGGTGIDPWCYVPGTFCTDQKHNGDACSGGTECASSNCVDGVCCESTCDGSCESCAAYLTGFGDGFCRNTSNGLDPNNDCQNGGAAACGNDGACNGAGNCRNYSDGTVCHVPICNGGDHQGNSTCQNLTCTAPALDDCGLYACQSNATSASCNLTCGGDNDCNTTDGAWCYGSSCTVLTHTGDACGADSECATGECVDGVCCESGCLGLCQACSATLTGALDGQCRDALSGLDPHNQCADEGVGACSQDGYCDGSGACRDYSDGTVCLGALCTNGDQQNQSTCAGGTCTAPTAIDCGAFGCSGGECNTTCTSNAQCRTQEGGWCYPAAGTCSFLSHHGDSCTGNNECGSGACENEFCCESECDTTCMACSQELTGFGDGLCRNILTNLQDPINPCTNQGPASCGQDGKCDGQGSCQQFSDGTICVAQGCNTDDNLIPQGLCVAQSCDAAATVDCGHFKCQSGNCPTTCSADGDCKAGKICYNSVCTDKLPQGGACSINSQCASSSCVDGVCCNSVCNGNCQACAATYTGLADGVCGDVLDGLDPGNDCANQGAAACAQDGACDGSGDCRNYASGTVCAQAACIGGDAYSQSTCTAVGVCTLPAANDCANYECNTSNAQCREGCTANSQCALGEGAWCYEETGTCQTGSDDGGAAIDSDGNSVGSGGGLSGGDGGGGGSTPEPSVDDIPGNGGGTGGPGGSAPGAVSYTICASGFAYDGYCCNTDCSLQGYSCDGGDTGAQDGVCAPILAGTDPDDECTDDGTSSCGRDGVLDGIGGCAIYSEGTVCASATCSNNDYVAPSTCSGDIDAATNSRSCSTPSATDCAGLYVCSGSACLTDCDAGDDCEGGGWCFSAVGQTTGYCTNLEQSGSDCAGNGECGSGACVDSVCCESTCTGTCMACSDALTGAGDGVCAPILAGTDPNYDCADAGASTCGQNGSCNGSGACQDYSDGTVCGAAGCSAGDLRPAKTCSGGSCTTPATSDCAPFKCRSGACRTSCSRNSHCDTGAVCYGDVCVSGSTDGTACTADGDCASGRCVDSYCCETACDAAGHSCARSDTGFGNGNCEPILAGLDPDNECAAQTASTCGRTGALDGAGGCQVYSNGTVCAAATCSGTNAVGESTCSSGTCTAPAAVDCGLYGCESAACLSSCADDTDCDTAAGSWCDTANNNMCSETEQDGSACSGSNECASTFCVDGVCSASACTGSCYSTIGTETGGNDGECLPVLSGRDPGGDCSDAGASTCDNDGYCNGSGGCRDYGSGTVCTAAGCSGGDVANADTCDGSGSCLDGGTTDCGNYICSGSSCRSSCSSNSHCASGSYCSGTTCTAEKGNGSSCTAGSQCSSGNCVDGYCCDSACSGSCQSCAAAFTASSDGVCANVDSGRDPDGDCAAAGTSTCNHDGYCDGSGGCRNYGSGTVCTSASCSGDNVLNADTCNGSGTCNDGGTTDCGAYSCSGSSCRSSCTQDGHCASGYWCSGTTCTSEKSNGSSCSNANECSSGNCVDGYCCNSSCTSSCQSCNGSYTASGNGVCANVSSGHDPRGDCSSGCKLSGNCNGSGACGAALPYITFIGGCEANGHNRTGTEYCDGSGGGLTACGDYTCELVGSGRCRTTCSQDSHCWDGFCVDSICVTNRPPVANNTSHEVNEDCAASDPNCGPLKDERVDASDPDGDPLTYEYIAVSAEANGALTGWTDGPNAGLWSYTPDSNFHGTVSFKYKASDGELWSSEATVTIKVISVNDPPTLSNIGNQSITMTQTTSGSGKNQTTSYSPKTKSVSFNIGDVDNPISDLRIGCSVSASCASKCSCDSTSRSSNGNGSTLTLNGKAVGSCTVTVRVDDGSASVLDTFTCTVSR